MMFCGTVPKTELSSVEIMTSDSVLVQKGDSCYCGNEFGGYPTSTPCDTPCVGNQSASCGGPNANSIYLINGQSLA